MEERWSREEALLGTKAIERLQNVRVAVFGIGGVGGFAAEALARSGVGNLTLMDPDKVNITNINRQIIALTSTLGQYKADVMKQRILDINPSANVTVCRTFFLPENANTFDFSGYDYVIDAVDTVTAKIQIIMSCKEAGVPVISSMGTGNKLDASKLMVGDIYETSVCPLAKVMRHELKKRAVKHLKVVFSSEEPVKKMRTPGSVAFVPPVAGLLLAGEVIKDLTADVMNVSDSD